LLAEHGLVVVDTDYTPAELGYELRATGAFSALKRAVRRRDLATALRAGFSACLALASYPIVWLVGRALGSERGDATVNLIAEARGAQATERSAPLELLA
jgi:hypothetical protein